MSPTSKNTLRLQSRGACSSFMPRGVTVTESRAASTAEETPCAENQSAPSLSLLILHTLMANPASSCYAHTPQTTHSLHALQTEATSACVFEVVFSVSGV